MADLSSHSRGQWGEEKAASHFRALGFEILERRWRPPERELRGDLDLIVRRDRLVVVCEVKARRDAARFGGAVAAVGLRKQSQVRLLTESWLRAHPSAAVDLRFDVIAIDGLRLTHVVGAF